MKVFPEDHVGENFFDVYYHPYKKQLWAAGILIAAVTLTVLGVRHYHKSRLDDQWTRYHDVVSGGDRGTLDSAQRLRRLQLLTNDYPDDPVTPFALSAMVNTHREAAEFGEAVDALKDLESRFPDFGLNTISSTGKAGGTSLSKRLQDVMVREADWTAKTKYEHRWPAEDRLALIETSVGNLWVGFYGDDAPDHVGSFIGHAKAGDYNGTQFYEIRTGTDGAPQLVRAGSRASHSEIGTRDPAEHDRDEPLHTQEVEDSRYTVKHKKRVVAAVNMPSGESDQRFTIITAEEGIARYDGDTSPFAAVLDKEGSLDTLDRIARAPTYDTNPKTSEQTGTFRMRDHPYPAVLIRRVSVWKNERLEDGHTWDTSRKASDEPEPWEATRGEDPLPKEFVKDRGSDDEDDDDTGDEGDDDESSDGDEGADEGTDDDGGNEDGAGIEDDDE